jgi:hypothetical protein
VRGAHAGADGGVHAELVVGVVENRRACAERLCDAGELFGECRLGEGFEALEGRGGVGEESVLLAERDAGGAPAGVGGEEQDVEKKSVNRVAVAGEQFAHMRLDVVLIVGVEEVVELPHAGLDVLLVGRGVPAGEAAGLVELAPFGMFLRDVFFPDDGGVERAANAGAVERLDLFTEEIAAFQRGMLRAGRGRIIRHAVMAFGEDRNALDVRAAKCLGEGGRVEFAADVGDKRRCVKIEMHMAGGQGKGLHG